MECKACEEIREFIKREARTEDESIFLKKEHNYIYNKAWNSALESIASILVNHTCKGEDQCQK